MKEITLRIDDETGDALNKIVSEVYGAEAKNKQSTTCIWLINKYHELKLNMKNLEAQNRSQQNKINALTSVLKNLELSEEMRTQAFVDFARIKLEK